LPCGNVLKLGRSMGRGRAGTIGPGPLGTARLGQAKGRPFGCDFENENSWPNAPGGPGGAHPEGGGGRRPPYGTDVHRLSGLRAVMRAGAATVQQRGGLARPPRRCAPHNRPAVLAHRTPGVATVLCGVLRHPGLAAAGAGSCASWPAGVDRPVLGLAAWGRAAMGGSPSIWAPHSGRRTGRRRTHTTTGWGLAAAAPDRAVFTPRGKRLCYRALREGCCGDGAEPRLRPATMGPGGSCRKGLRDVPRTCTGTAER